MQRRHVNFFSFFNGMEGADGVCVCERERVGRGEQLEKGIKI